MEIMVDLRRESGHKDISLSQAGQVSITYKLDVTEFLITFWKNFVLFHYKLIFKRLG